MILKFEGEDIDGLTVLIKQHKGPLTTPLTRGERVQLTITGEVTEVNFRENRRNGQVYRDHVIVVTDVEVL